MPQSEKQQLNAPSDSSQHDNDAFDSAEDSVEGRSEASVEIHSADSVEMRLSARQDDSVRQMQRRVLLRLIFTKVGDIDTVRECYEASVYLEARWREPTLGALAEDDATAVTAALATCWQPDLYVDNCIGDPVHRVSRELLPRDLSGELGILERHSFRGRFFERMELHHFPFDTQDITVTICSNLPETGVELGEMPDRPSRVITSTFTDVQEWSLHTHVEASRISVISHNRGGPQERQAVQFSTRATRRAMFYLVNIWLVSFVLCMLAMCVFSLSRQNLFGRLTLSLILLLTTVTFKMVIATHIPKISYFTMLDKVVMLNMMYLVLLIIWHTLAFLAPATHPLQTDEVYAIITFAGVYVIGVAAIWLQIVFGGLRRQKLMDEKDRQYQITFPTRNFTSGAQLPRS